MNRIGKMFLLRTAVSKNRFSNLINLYKKNGHLRCPNGFVLSFDSNNERDIKRVFEFSITYGVKFSDDQGSWNYKRGIITTPQGIKFKINMFNPIIFAETFLSDIHFTDFNLDNRTIVQAGGFIGDTALYYAYRGANVYSFEPEINLFNLALENIKLNPELSKRIVMKNYAIANDKTIEFPLDPDGSGGSSVYSLNGKKTISVRSVSIETILKEFSISDPYLLDLDIKGKEFDVINDQSISKFKRIRIEYSTLIDGKKVGERQLLIEKLKEYGFNRFRIYKGWDGETDVLSWEGVPDLMDWGVIEATK